MNTATSAHEPEPRRARCAAWLALLALLAAVVFVRVHAVADDPVVSAGPRLGLLKSDPALLAYVTERLIENGGWPPSDFRADARVEYPESADLAVLTAVGIEFVIAWAKLYVAPAAHLIDVALWTSTICACLSFLGVFLLARELGAGARWSLFAALAAACLPANHRTLGLLFIDEDLALPAFVLHLALLARAVRTRGTGAIALSALALGIACSTWHATRHFAALEALVVFAWFLRTQRNPLAAHGAWIFVLVVLLFALVVPVLRETWFVTSFALLCVWSLAAAALIPRRPRVVALVSLVVLAGIGAVLRDDGAYAHVFALLRAKLAHAGQLPADPNQLPFEVRLMWQGPFATLELDWAAQQLGLGLLAVIPAAVLAWRAWQRPPHDERTALVATLVCICWPIAYLIVRTLVLPSLLVAAVAACQLAAHRRFAAVAWTLLAVQAVWFWTWIAHYENPWYYRPKQRQAEIAAMLAAVRAHVPAGEAIVTDFMNSPALLLDSAHPIVMQPKWETRRARARVQRFFDVFYGGSCADLRQLVSGEWKARYLLVDRFTLGYLARYSAGYPTGVWQPGSAAEVLLAQDQERLEGVSGFRLLWRSPKTILQTNGEPTDFYRLYLLDPP